MTSRVRCIYSYLVHGEFHLDLLKRELPAWEIWCPAGHSHRSSAASGFPPHSSATDHPATHGKLTFKKGFFVFK
jgi:hypothetical protein